MNRAERIVVLGGTGFVGRTVCEHLMRRSTTGAIVVPTRRAMHANTVRALPTVDVRLADVHGVDHRTPVALGPTGVAGFPWGVAEAPGGWRIIERKSLGPDILQVMERV